MITRKSYWVVSLSILLSLSLALPYCCHADISELFSPRQKLASHGTAHGEHQDAQSCDCGHEFVKDFQKTKKVVTSQNIFPSLTGVLNQKLTIGLLDQRAMYLIAAQPGILADAGPPLYLLNSVFLI